LEIEFTKVGKTIYHGDDVCASEFFEKRLEDKVSKENVGYW